MQPKVDAATDAPGNGLAGDLDVVDHGDGLGPDESGAEPGEECRREGEVISIDEPLGRTSCSPRPPQDVPEGGKSGGEVLQWHDIHEAEEGRLHAFRQQGLSSPPPKTPSARKRRQGFRDKDG